MSSSVANRFASLCPLLSSCLWQKEAELSLGLLCLVGGESLLLLGPPGVAKSMIANRLTQCVCGGQVFSYLMSRFSTPDEIFGPVSISSLKDSDCYLRLTSGYLPSADVAFLDEIWKAGPAIQNSLLTIINERVFRNGAVSAAVPLKLLVAASNELPARGEGLEALWDRFVVRVVCRNISGDADFRSMLLCRDSPAVIPDGLKISPSDFSLWQPLINSVSLPASVVDAILAVRRDLSQTPVSGSDQMRAISLSDRRWRRIARLVQVSAFVNGRQDASLADLLFLPFCLWNEPDEWDGVCNIVVSRLFSDLDSRLSGLAERTSGLNRDIQAGLALESMSRAGDQDLELRVYDSLFFHVLNHGSGHTFIFVADYRSVVSQSDYTAGHAPTCGVISDDPEVRGRSLIRILQPSEAESELGPGVHPVKLLRARHQLFINGLRFNLECGGGEEGGGGFASAPAITSKSKAADLLFSQMESLASDIRERGSSLRSSVLRLPAIEALALKSEKSLLERLAQARRLLSEC